MVLEEKIKEKIAAIDWKKVDPRFKVDFGIRETHPSLSIDDHCCAYYWIGNEQHTYKGDGATYRGLLNLMLSKYVEAVGYPSRF